jgi:hypothetical protein
MEPAAREVTLEHHRALLSLLVEPLKHHGLRKNRWGFWKASADGAAFAGFLAKPKLVRGSKRLEFSAITMGGHRDLHDLFARLYAPGKKFDVGPQFAQFDHDLLEPRGQAFLAKLWTIWPSTDVASLAHELESRLIEETMPAVEVILDHERLAAALEEKMVGGRIYIRARNYALTKEAIHRLRSSGNAYS